MVLTETEAASRWCPFVRESDEAERPVTVNRLTSGGKVGVHAWNACMGSRCMAWRWKDAPVMRFAEYRTNPAATEEPVRPDLIPDAWQWRPANPDDGDPAGWLEDEASYLARRKGGCGLVSPTAPEIATAVLDSTMG